MPKNTLISRHQTPDFQGIRQILPIFVSSFQAATKVDFADLRAESKLDWAALRVEIKQNLVAHQAATDVNFAKMRTEIAGVRSELIKWMFIFWVGQIGALVTFLLAVR